MFPQYRSFFFFNDTATTEIYTLSLHDALPICKAFTLSANGDLDGPAGIGYPDRVDEQLGSHIGRERSEEHTSELQSRQYLVCRLLLAKINNGSSKINLSEGFLNIFPLLKLL